MIHDTRLIFSILKNMNNEFYSSLKQHFTLVFLKQNSDQLRHDIVVAFDVTYKDAVIFTDAP